MLLAQVAEHWTMDPKSPGSNPAQPIKINLIAACDLLLISTYYYS